MMLTKMPGWKNCGIVSEQRSRMRPRMPQTRWSRRKPTSRDRHALAPAAAAGSGA
jgi:hypothetical protein